MNEQLMLDDLKKAYRSIRIIKLVQKGLRDSMQLSKKVGCQQQLANYYIKRYTHENNLNSSPRT